MIDPRTPVIVGIAQKTFRQGADPGPEPLLGWEEACRLAAADAGISDAALAGADILAVAQCMSWAYDDAPGRLAACLDAKPRRLFYSAPSGTAGQSMLEKAAADIRAGRAEMAVVCGGESLATRKRLAAHGEIPRWSFPRDPALGPEFDLDTHQHPGEVRAGLTEGVGAVYTFAMRDIARRAHLGIAPDAYRRQLGTLLSGMTQVAATNPDAWFREARDGDFLTTPRADNRIVAYPYTKHMVAMIEVDIYGALILTSEAKADQLAIPAAKRVYPWTSCYAEDPVYTAVREHLWKSEAMAEARNATLAAAGVSMDEVAHVDLYSCFAAAVNFGRDALGIAGRGGDRITVTGGLPYGGGPGSSYMLTSLVKMVERLRRDPGTIGLVSGVGMMMSNHSFGLYSTRPPSPALRPIDGQAVQKAVDATPRKQIDQSYAGPATVVTYTVMHDRTGARSHGAAICDLPNGARAYARILDPDLLAEAEAVELVGRQMRILGGKGIGELRGG